MRPYPRPDDITYAVQAINRWAVEAMDDLPTQTRPGTSLADVGREFHGKAYGRSRRQVVGLIGWWERCPESGVPEGDG